MSHVQPNRFLIDAEEFKEELASRIALAKHRVFVQVMTFECDEVGNWLLGCMKKSPAKSKKLIVDAYSLVNVNDGLAFGSRYFSDRDFKQEVNETRRLLKAGKTEGIDVHLTNGMGWNPALYPFRNHKKMIIIDDTLYLGGLNFSEHNFEWHDFMVRFEDVDLVERATQDIESTIKGIDQSIRVSSKSSELYFVNGNKSQSQYREVFNLIKFAKKDIKILSPYVSNPLLRELAEVDVTVDIITPQANNKGIMTRLLLGVAANRNWNIHLYSKGMTHAKAILIDEEVLIVGSSNFDFVSYELEQEVIMVTKERELIAEFMQRVWNRDLSSCHLYSNPERKFLGARMAIFVAETFIKFLGLFKKG